MGALIADNEALSGSGLHYGAVDLRKLTDDINDSAKKKNQIHQLRYYPAT